MAVVGSPSSCWIRPQTSPKQDEMRRGTTSNRLGRRGSHALRYCSVQPVGLGHERRLFGQASGAHDHRAWRRSCERLDSPCVRCFAKGPLQSDALFFFYARAKLVLHLGAFGRQLGAEGEFVQDC